MRFCLALGLILLPLSPIDAAQASPAPALPAFKTEGAANELRFLSALRKAYDARDIDKVLALAHKNSFRPEAFAALRKAFLESFKDELIALELHAAPDEGQLLDAIFAGGAKPLPRLRVTRNPAMVSMSPISSKERNFVLGAAVAAVGRGYKGRLLLNGADACIFNFKQEDSVISAPCEALRGKVRYEKNKLEIVFERRDMKKTELKINVYRLSPAGALEKFKEWNFSKQKKGRETVSFVLPRE